jgi:hypothetical protein
LLKNPEPFGSFARTMFRLEEDIYGAIDLASSPDVLPAESPSKVASSVPSPGAEENPTSADWSPGDSG